MITEYSVMRGMEASGLGAEDAGVLVRPNRAYSAVLVEAWEDDTAYALVSISAEDAAALARHVLDMTGREVTE